MYNSTNNLNPDNIDKKEFCQLSYAKYIFKINPDLERNILEQVLFALHSSF